MRAGLGDSTSPRATHPRGRRPAVGDFERFPKPNPPDLLISCSSPLPPRPHLMIVGQPPITRTSSTCPVSTLSHATPLSVIVVPSIVQPLLPS